jgi:hypothetical protein
MFCGKCGNKTVEGNSFCTTCGQGLTTPSLSLSSAVPKLDQLEPAAAMSMAAKTVEGTLPVSRPVTPRVVLTQPDGKPLYCRHSPAERTMLGAEREHGSATCLGCKLPYAPGSPNSRVGPVSAGTARIASRPPSHFTWALVSLVFFCWPLAIPAIVSANQVNPRWAAGDIAGAQAASNSAQNWAMAATIVGACLWLLVIVGAAAGSFS